MIAHIDMRANAPEICDNMRAIAPKGAQFSFLFSKIDPRKQQVARCNRAFVA